MHHVSPTAPAASHPLHGIFIEDDTDGMTRLVFIDRRGEVIRRDTIRSDLLTDTLLGHFHDWLDGHNAALSEPPLHLVR